MSEVLRCDVVVVGAGVHGSSAALHLARAGKDTILLEQFPVPHSRGSSHGQSRIIRLANYGIPQLTPIMNESFHQWRRIQEQAGQTLLSAQPESKVRLLFHNVHFPSMFCSSLSSLMDQTQPLLLMARSGNRSSIERMARSVEQGGHTPEWVKPSDINAKYKMNLPPSSLAFFDHSAGVLMADKCLSSLQKLFQASGGRLVDEWAVKDVGVGDDGVCEVRGPKGVVRAHAVVLCPGPWAGPLLNSLGIHIPLRVERVSVFYWRLKDQSTSTPIFMDRGERKAGDNYYGIPEIEYPGMVKVCCHAGLEVDPNNRDQRVNNALRDQVKLYVRETFPGLVPEPSVEEACLYTVTPDSEFVLDRHPSHRNIFYACGFSGSGFKIAPAVGEELCRLVLGLSPRHDLKPFSAARFTAAPPSKM